MPTKTQSCDLFYARDLGFFPSSHMAYNPFYCNVTILTNCARTSWVFSQFQIATFLVNSHNILLFSSKRCSLLPKALYLSSDPPYRRLHNQYCYQRRAFSNEYRVYVFLCFPFLTCVPFSSLLLGENFVRRVCFCSLFLKKPS